ncbi:hypothetical protein [Porphyrobacter sp. AAP82]|uniref:hypothetical protein n=1 Tax=Porphyrobacter sp. AAP82 TaxID=1248917 RepID=UPI0012DECDA8|nr:hypothetical protein [Porphyrobacter sp. AAP82]
MPAMFIAASSKFIIARCEGEDTPAKKLEKAYRKFLEINIFQPETPNIGIKFEISDDNIQEGALEIEPNGDTVVVNCDFVAKINVKSNYVDQFLDPKSKWVFGSASDVEGAIEGLESQEYEVKSFRGTQTETNYLIPVKTAKNIKGLK